MTPIGRHPLLGQRQPGPGPTPDLPLLHRHPARFFKARDLFRPCRVRDLHEVPHIGELGLLHRSESRDDRQTHGRCEKGCESVSRMRALTATHRGFRRRTARASRQAAAAAGSAQATAATTTKATLSRKMVKPSTSVCLAARDHGLPRGEHGQPHDHNGVRQRADERSRPPVPHRHRRDESELPHGEQPEIADVPAASPRRARLDPRNPLQRCDRIGLFRHDTPLPSSPSSLEPLNLPTRHPVSALATTCREGFLLVYALTTETREPPSSVSPHRKLDGSCAVRRVTSTRSHRPVPPRPDHAHLRRCSGHRPPAACHRTVIGSVAPPVCSRPTSVTTLLYAFLPRGRRSLTRP